ncbi:hypothetical protein Tco_1455163 [Tanacetum coccineum]
MGEVSPKQCGSTKISARRGSHSKDVHSKSKDANVKKEGEGVESEANVGLSSKRSKNQPKAQPEPTKSHIKAKPAQPPKHYKDDEQVDDEETSLKIVKRRRKQKGPSETNMKKELLDREYPKIRSRVVYLSLFRANRDAKVNMKLFLDSIGFGSLHGIRSIKVNPEKVHDMFGVPIGERSFVSLDEKPRGRNDPLYLDATKFEPMLDVRLRPAIKGWNSTLMKNLMELEIKQGVFGELELQGE